MNNSKGLVIAFDGPDGVGKSTQLELTANWLSSNGYTVHTTRASGGTPIGEELRKAMLSSFERSAETDVYIALAMETAISDDIQARRSKGSIILVDRSPLSIIAYNTYGSQLTDKSFGIEAAKKMLRAWGLDVLVYFDTDQSVIDLRRQHRTDKPLDYYEKQDAAFHERVREGYEVGLNLAKHEEGLINAIIEVDAGPDINTIQQDVQAQLKKML